MKCGGGVATRTCSAPSAAAPEERVVMLPPASSRRWRELQRGRFAHRHDLIVVEGGVNRRVGLLLFRHRHTHGAAQVLRAASMVHVLEQPREEVRSLESVGERHRHPLKRARLDGCKLAEAHLFAAGGEPAV